MSKKTKKIKVQCKGCGEMNDKPEDAYSCKCRHCGYETFYFVRLKRG